MEIETETIEQDYLSVDGDKYPVYRVLEVAGELRHTDGFIRKMTATGIHSDVAEMLVERGLATKSASGAYYVNDKDELKEFIDRVRELQDDG